MDHNKVYEIALGMVPGIGGATTKVLISYCGSPEKIFNTPKGKLLQIPGIGTTTAEAIIKSKDKLLEAEKQVELSIKSKTSILFYTDKNYPERLKHIYDAPPLLYYKGTSDLNSDKIVGIVGTRNATDYGKDQVEKIVEGLAKYNPIIISGLAYGIDITSHKAALRNNLQTVAAMATGLDKIYPSSHREVARKMEDNGGLITEYNFGSKLEPSKFPARNRIIAGLCDVLVVAEAAAKGGALITAEMANEYNREVFSLPGNLGNKYSEGCNRLIQKNKAHIFTDCEGLAAMMNWDLEKKKKAEQINLFSTMEGLEEEEKVVLQILSENHILQIDEISWKSNIPLSRLAGILLNLEFKGIVKNMPGKKFKLIT